jgi:hypothetical protein
MGGSGNVRLKMTALTFPSAMIDCLFQVSAGQGSVSSSRLSQLPAGGAVLAIVVEAETPLTAGDWTIRLHAQSAALHSDGSEIQGQALQLQ